MERDLLMKAYCMKCRDEREIKDARAEKMMNGNTATKGSCSICGTNVCIIGKKYQPSIIPAYPPD
jgi:hypothetical protein